MKKFIIVLIYFALSKSVFGQCAGCGTTINANSTGVLNVASGTTCITGGTHSHAINVSGTGTVCVSGAAVISGLITVTGGTFTKSATSTGNITGGITASAGTVTISGNTTTVSGVAINVSGTAAVTVSATTIVSSAVNISGGTFTKSSSGNLTGLVTATGGTTTISSGTTSGGITANGGDVTVSGGTVSTNAITINNASSDVTVSGTTIISSAVNISNGTFTKSSSGNLTGLVTASGGTTTISAGATSGGITVSGGTATVSGGTITGGTLSASAGTLNIGVSTSRPISGNGGLINVTGGTYSGTASMNSGTINIASGGTMSSTATLNGGTFSNAGTFTGTIAWNTASAITNTGIWNSSSALTLPNGSSFTNSGSGSFTSGALTVGGSFTNTNAASTLTINGNLTTYANSPFNSNSPLTVTGNLEVGGVFNITSTTGEVFVDGTTKTNIGSNFSSSIPLRLDDDMTINASFSVVGNVSLTKPGANSDVTTNGGNFSITGSLGTIRDFTINSGTSAFIGGGVTVTKDMIVNAPITIRGNSSVGKDLTINGTGGILNFSSGVMTVDNNFTNSGTVTGGSTSNTCGQITVAKVSNNNGGSFGSGSSSTDICDLTPTVAGAFDVGNTPVNSSSCTCAGVLPLDWRLFTALPKGNSVELSWINSKPCEGSRFQIEKGVDGLNFTTIGSQTCISPENRYTFIDVAKEGTFYYRIKRVGKENSDFSYSDVRFVSIGSKSKFSIVPNPSSGLITITNENNALIKNVVIFTTLGQQLLQLDDLNQNEITLDLSTYSKGVYFVNLISEDNSMENLLLKLEN